MITTFKTLRERSQQTPREAAEKLGKTEGSYRKYECSHRIPKTEVLIKMIKVYKCTPDELFKALKYHIRERDRKLKEENFI